MKSLNEIPKFYVEKFDMEIFNDQLVVRTTDGALYLPTRNLEVGTNYKGRWIDLNTHGLFNLTLWKTGDIHQVVYSRAAETMSEL